MQALLAVLWAAGQPLLYAAPVIIMAKDLPRRPHFIARCLACYLIMAAFLLAQPSASLFTEPLTVGELWTNILFYTGILMLNGVFIFFCHDVPPRTATFCSVVGYTVENLGSCLSTVAGLLAGNPDALIGSPADILLTRAFWCVLVYIAFFQIVHRQIERNRLLQVNPSKMAFSLVLSVVIFNIMFDIVTKQLYQQGIPFRYALMLRVVVAAASVFSLLLEHEMLLRQHMESEAAALSRLMQTREAQYELSRGTIEAVNMKMHDIRHQIRSIETDGTKRVVDKGVLRDIAREVKLYDAAVKTGNETLDVILTEKSLLGQSEQISLACIADGSALDFMPPADLYALLGNALENAFDAVRLLDDPEQRNISLLVRRVAGMASIHIENYFSGEISYDAAGNPMTSKLDKESHGYGVRSMRQICERYGGTLTIEVQDNTFAVNMLIPIP